MSTAADVLVVLGVGLATVAVSMTAAALRTRQLDRVAVVDVAWGAGFVLVALTTALTGTLLGDGAVWRRWLVVALVAAWGLRLAWHVRSRALGEHQGAEDPRYADLLGGAPSQVGMGSVVRRVFLVQALAQWVVAAPLMVGAVSDAPWWPAVVAGVVVWATGLFFEAVGDRQLTAYKERPRGERPQVMDAGLWGWTRHPNYFGDACVWWGLWLVAGLGSGWVAGLATVVCPVVMTFVLVQVTGARLLERTMMRRPGYPAYASRVPMFLPRPPRRSS